MEATLRLLRSEESDSIYPTTHSNKKSSVRHTRAIQGDRSKRPVVAPPDEQIEARLRTLVLPAIATQEAVVRKLGLRRRLLPLSVLVALVIGLIWRQLGTGGSEAARWRGAW